MKMFAVLARSGLARRIRGPAQPTCKYFWLGNTNCEDVLPPVAMAVGKGSATELGHDKRLELLGGSPSFRCRRGRARKEHGDGAPPPRVRAPPNCEDFWLGNARIAKLFALLERSFSERARRRGWATTGAPAAEL